MLVSFKPLAMRVPSPASRTRRKADANEPNSSYQKLTTTAG